MFIQKVKSTRLSAFTLCMLLALLWSNDPQAATYSIKQLTNNNKFDRLPQLSDNGDVVWLAPDDLSYDDEVFLYDSSAGKIIQLFENDIRYESDTVINARGDIVWRRWDGFKYNLFLYDTTKSPPAITQIAEHEDDIFSPHMNDNGDVVYSTRPGGSGDDLEVFYYDRTTKTSHQLTNNDTYDGAPKICGNGDIAWTHNDGDNEIMLYDQSADTLMILSNNTYNDHYVEDVNDRGDVVWKATMPGSNDEIFVYESASKSVKQFQSLDCDEYSPDINDHGDIVWSMSCPGTDREIIMYNNSTKKAEPITTNDWDDYLPHLNNKRNVVWKGYSKGRPSYELYVYESADKKITKLTNNDFEEHIVSINNKSQISWHAQVGPLGSGEIEIFLATPGDSPPPPPPPGDSAECYPWLLLLLKQQL